MSLKAFHVVFVTVATLLAMGVGVWCLRIRESGYVPIGMVSIGVAVALVVYGVWFLRKMKGVSYL